MEFYILPSDKWDELVETMNNKPDNKSAIARVVADAELVSQSKLVKDQSKSSIMFDGRVFIKGVSANR